MFQNVSLCCLLCCCLGNRDYDIINCTLCHGCCVRVTLQGSTISYYYGSLWALLLNLDVSVPVRMKLPNGNSLPYSDLISHLPNNYFIPPSFASIMISVDGLLFMKISASLLMIRLRDFTDLKNSLDTGGTDTHSLLSLLSRNKREMKVIAHHPSFINEWTLWSPRKRTLLKSEASFELKSLMKEQLYHLYSLYQTVGSFFGCRFSFTETKLESLLSGHQENQSEYKMMFDYRWNQCFTQPNVLSCHWEKKEDMAQSVPCHSPKCTEINHHHPPPASGPTPVLHLFVYSLTSFLLRQL